MSEKAVNDIKSILDEKLEKPTKSTNKEQFLIDELTGFGNSEYNNLADINSTLADIQMQVTDGCSKILPKDKYGEVDLILTRK